VVGASGCVSAAPPGTNTYSRYRPVVLDTFVKVDATGDFSRTATDFASFYRAAPAARAMQALSSAGRGTGLEAGWTVLQASARTAVGVTNRRAFNNLGRYGRASGEQKSSQFRVSMLPEPEFVLILEAEKSSLERFDSAGLAPCGRGNLGMVVACNYSSALCQLPLFSASQASRAQASATLVTRTFRPTQGRKLRRAGSVSSLQTSEA
jgi:hypothetical protein